MKSNFFKIVFPAFALMLAITASLAFTPAEVNMEDDFAQYQVEYLDANSVCQTVTQTKDCQLTGSIACTINIFGTPFDLYLDPNDPIASTLIPPVTTRCTFPLKKIGS